MDLIERFLGFQEAAAALWKAHRQHLDNLEAGDASELPRSRRALYNALKAYRHSETELHRAVTGTDEDKRLKNGDTP
jgi:hypothetical protein